MLFIPNNARIFAFRQTVQTDLTQSQPLRIIWQLVMWSFHLLKTNFMAFSCVTFCFFSLEDYARINGPEKCGKYERVCCPESKHLWIKIAFFALVFVLIYLSKWFAPPEKGDGFSEYIEVRLGCSVIFVLVLFYNYYPEDIEITCGRINWGVILDVTIRNVNTYHQVDRYRPVSLVWRSDVLAVVFPTNLNFMKLDLEPLLVNMESKSSS